MADPYSTRVPQTPVEYYGSFTDSPDLLDKFNDIDDEVHFHDYLRLLQKYDTKNFVLDFGNDDAWCALNLEESDFTSLLGKYVCTLLYNCGEFYANFPYRGQDSSGRDGCK